MGRKIYHYKFKGTYMDKTCMICGCTKTLNIKNLTGSDIYSLWSFRVICKKCEDYVCKNAYSMTKEMFDKMMLWFVKYVSQRYGKIYRKIDYRLAENVVSTYTASKDYD